MSENEIALPPKAQERLKASIAQANQIQQAINTYFQGICDGLGLEGEWSLDINRMIAVRKQEPSPAPKEANSAGSQTP